MRRANVVRCKRCLIEVVRTRGKKRPSKGYYYVDNNGSYWGGHVCPSCFNQDLSSEASVYKARTRPCRVCKKPLPGSLYFTHPECSRVDYRDIFSEYQNHARVC